MPPHSSHSQQHSQQSQSTVRITTPTPTVTNPQFSQSFQHPPPAPAPQVNQQLNYQARSPQFNQQFTQPSLPQVSPLLMPPQPFNPQVLPPYFAQYPPSNSPSAGSNDSSILAALQKQWEKQERIDKECFDMERQKEERKRMKEEREQKKGNKRKKNKKDWRNEKTNNAPVSTRLLRRFPDSMVPIPVIALIGWNRQKHWSMNTKEGYTEKSCYSTVAPVYPRPSTHYLKEPQTNKLKMQYYETIPTLELFHNAPMHTNSYTRSLMKLYRHTTQDTHHTSISPTLNWK